MNSTRNPSTITAELSDLRRYIRGLPKDLLATGAFVAYKNREALLQEELIAAQLYQVVGEPEEVPQSFSGLKGQIAAIAQRISELQDMVRRKARISTAIARALPTLATGAALGAGYFVVEARDRGALLSLGAAVIFTLLNSLFDSRRQLAEHRHLSRELEAMKWKLDEYVKTEGGDDPEAKVQREMLLGMVRELAETKSQLTTG